jgi:hypothetical protein
MRRKRARIMIDPSATVSARLPRTRAAVTDAFPAALGLLGYDFIGKVS